MVSLRERDVEVLARLAFRSKRFNELKEEVGWHQFSLSRRLKRLMDTGLVSREAGRKGKWFLTDRGYRILFEKAPGVYAERFTRVFSELTESSSLRVISLMDIALKTIVASIEEVLRGEEIDEAERKAVSILEKIVHRILEEAEKARERGEEAYVLSVMIKPLWYPVLMAALLEILGYIRRGGRFRSIELRNIARMLIRELKEEQRSSI